MSKPLIIGISGRKQSGKSTTANYLYHNLKDVRFQNITIFTFAEPLKEMLRTIMGLTWEQLNGTDEQKNSLTKYRWEDMPGIITNSEVVHSLKNQGWYTKYLPSSLGNYREYTMQKHLTYHEPGYMTGRDMMEYVGTKIYRKMNGDMWRDTAFRYIDSGEGQFKKCDLVLMPDVRFPNEVLGINERDGFVLRLTRDEYQSKHEAECALDPENFDWSNFAGILYNKGACSEDTKNKEALRLVESLV